LVDVVDSVFQAEHATSMRHRPAAEDVARNLSLHLRAQVVNWLSIACHAVGLDDQILHGAVLTLDRYCALQTRPIAEARLLRLSLAVLCTEMKLAPIDEFPSGTWQRLLLHLGQGRESLPDIFAMEAEVLRQVGFNVWVPTALTFLRGLGLRLCQGPEDVCFGRAGPASTSAALQLAFARFFVELAMYNPFLQYRFPFVVLAAAALGAAQFATGSSCPLVHETLLEDLASYCPDLHDSRGLAEECERLILEMWRDCAQGSSQWTDFYEHLRQRHSRPLRGPAMEDAVLSRFGDHLQPAAADSALQSYFALTA